MNWFVFILFSVLFASVGGIIQKILMKGKKSDSISFSIIFQFICTLFIGVYAFLNGFTFPPITQFPLNFLFLAICYTGATLFTMQAFKYTQVSQIAVLGSSSIIWTVLASVFLLGESFTLQQSLGALLVMGAIFLVSYTKSRITLNKGDVYVLLAAFCFGVAVVNDAYILRASHTDVASYTAIAFLLPGIFLIGIYPTAIKKTKMLFIENAWVKMIVFSFFYAASAILYYFSYTHGANMSQIGPISKTSVIVTILLAAVFLGERDNEIKKLLSAILVICGVLLLR